MRRTGVYLEGNYFRCCWNEENGSQKSRTFRIDKHGKELALYLANKCYENKYYRNIIYKLNDDISIMEIPYNKELFKVYFDTSDFEKVSKYKWYIAYPPGATTHYVGCYELNTRLHRFIMGVNDPKLQVDHLDHNGLNNTKKNLRIVTNEENQKNLSFKSNNKSGVIGVRYNKQIECWQAQWVDKNTKKQHVKSFNINKYGNEKAKQLAIEYRLKMAKENGYLTGLNK